MIFRLTFLLLLLASGVTQAIIPRNVSVDVGFGVPHLIYGQGVVKVSDHWQVGLGYGMIPGLAAMGENIKLEEQQVTLGGTTQAVITPTLNIGLNTLLPFVRFFPRDNNFYIQATYVMWQVKSEVSGTMKTDDVLAAEVGLITGTANITQPIPTVSVGHIWAGQAYFCDLSLGFSFFLPASASIELNTLIPDALGGAAGNEAAINQLSSQMTTQINDATSGYRSRFPVLPSLSFTFGIML